MADNKWQKGEIIEVFQFAGTAETGKQRYRKAPFLVLRWAATLNGAVDNYVLPRGFEPPTVNLTDKLDEQSDMEFGFLNGNQIMLEPHMTLNECHSFGYI
jgi:hypothetical protein